MNQWIRSFEWTSPGDLYNKHRYLISQTSEKIKTIIKMDEIHFQLIASVRFMWFIYI